MRYLLAFVLCTSLFYACSDCSSLEADEEIILDYITDNNLSAERTAEGVYYVIGIPGNSEKPSTNSTITIDYRGYLLDGTEFDSGEAFSSQLWRLIEGWQIGIPQFGKGGSGTLLIPSTLAYGCEAQGSVIPANAVLAFDITLIDFQ